MKKKSKRKESWEQKIIQNLSERWTDRHRKYALAEQEEQEQEQYLASEQEQNDPISNQQNKYIKEKCENEMSSCRKEVFDKISADSQLGRDNLGALILPSVSPSSPASTEDLVSKMGITGITRVFFASTIQSEQKKTSKALEEAKFYRNLAERMRKEKNDFATAANRKIEMVQEFWRNNVKEGSSRAGRMVRCALMKQNTH